MVGVTMTPGAPSTTACGLGQTCESLKDQKSESEELETSNQTLRTLQLEAGSTGSPLPAQR